MQPVWRRLFPLQPLNPGTVLQSGGKRECYSARISGRTRTDKPGISARIGEPIRQAAEPDEEKGNDLVIRSEFLL